MKEGLPQDSNALLLQLSGITFNNLACYYKKTKKPKVALKYLKKALEIEVFRVSNWTSIAGTHLNICAIYSFMKKYLFTNQATNKPPITPNSQSVSYKRSHLTIMTTHKKPSLTLTCTC